MKKFLSVLLAAMIALSPTACGGDKAQQSETIPTVSDVLVRSSYDEVSGSYYNSYTQLTVTPPGDWYIYRDSDLAASYLNGEVTGDEFSVWGSADFEKHTVVPDIAFQDMANSNNLSVVYVNLDNPENGQITDKDTFHGLVIENLKAQGFALDQTDDEIIVLGGQDFYLFKFKGKDTKRYFAIKQQDNYMIVITATDCTDAGKDMFFGFIG